MPQKKLKAPSTQRIPSNAQKYRAYELFKLRLLKRGLKPEQYEAAVQAYCQRNGL